jgi:NAD(P)-dependent dehydrogenase (short-subunit alcohol dehydrogenase family)
MVRSYVVTGGGRGVGRAVAERLLRDGGAVVIIELDAEAVAWAKDHPAAPRIAAVTGQRQDLERFVRNPHGRRREPSQPAGLEPEPGRSSVPSLRERPWARRLGPPRPRRGGPGGRRSPAAAIPGGR